MNLQSRSLMPTAALTLFVLIGFGSASAQSQVNRRFHVSANGAPVVVETSASKELVSVSIQRQNQPTHYYNAYVQIPVTAVRIGRQTLFTIYHNEERIEAGSFNFTFSQVNGIARSQRKEIIAIRQRLSDDARILRAIRAYDKDADVLLAELAYALVTYDNSILDGAVLNIFNVTEVPQTSAKKEMNNANPARVALRVSALQDSLAECIDGANQRYNECQADPNVRDKSICYNNRSREIQICYSVYGGKEKQPIQP